MLRRSIVRVKIRFIRVAKHPKIRRTIKTHVTQSALTSLTTTTLMHKGHVTPDVMVDFASTQLMTLAIEITKIGVHLLLK